MFPVRVNNVRFATGGPFKISKKKSKCEQTLSQGRSKTSQKITNLKKNFPQFKEVERGFHTGFEFLFLPDTDRH